MQQTDCVSTSRLWLKLQWNPGFLLCFVYCGCFCHWMWECSPSTNPTDVLSHPDGHCWASWCRGQVSANGAVLWKCFTCSLCSPPCSSELRWQIWVTQVPMWRWSRRRRKVIPEFDLQEDFCDRKPSVFRWWRTAKFSTRVTNCFLRNSKKRFVFSQRRFSFTISWTWGTLWHEHLSSLTLFDNSTTLVQQMKT